VLTYFYTERNVQVRKQILSTVSGHVLYLLHKISRTIHVYLSALHERKDPAAAEIRSSSYEPATHGFLD